MTANTSIDADVIDLLDAFDRAEVDYVIVGAHALGVHGIVRATSDFDVLVLANTENSKRVVRALTDFGAPLKTHGVGADYFAVPERVYQMGLPPKRIDLITSMTGVSSDEAFATAIVTHLDTKKRRVLSLETLLKNKKATGRPKDLLDVTLLKKALKAQHPKTQRNHAGRSAPRRRK